MLNLPADRLARGVTAVSAGNHAIAVAYAAQVLGTTAKVAMPRTANPFRVAKCRELGAAVELVEDVHRAFVRVKQIEEEEGRTFVHPFEGPRTALGTATLGLELVEQVPELEAVVVPIGFYLLWLSDSKTSTVCLLVGSAIIAAVRLPLLRRRISAMGFYFLATAVAFFLLDSAFGISTVSTSSIT